MLRFMQIDLFGYVKRELNAIQRANWAALAKATGVPESTIEKIAYGVSDDPGVKRVQILANALMNRVLERPANGRGRRRKLAETSISAGR